MIQRETVKIKFGKTLSKDYNSVTMMIEETYLVSAEVNFNRKDFVMMKCQEFEDIIDAKIQPPNNVASGVSIETPAKTVAQKYPQTKPTAKAETSATNPKKGICRFCQKELDISWHTNCKECYAKHMK